MTKPSNAHGPSDGGAASADAQHHDELLEAVVSGDLDASHPSVQTAGKASPHFRERLGAVQRTEHALRDTAQAERSDLAYAATLGGGALEAAEDRLRERISFAFDRPRGLSWRAVAAAALVLIACGAYLASRGKGGQPIPEQPPVYLGAGLACLAPNGECAEFDVFVWSGDLPRGAKFELTIFDATGREIDRFTALSDRELQVAPERYAKLPDRIRWQIAVKDSGGTSATSLVEAWRKR